MNKIKSIIFLGLVLFAFAACSDGSSDSEKDWLPLDWIYKDQSGATYDFRGDAFEAKYKDTKGNEKTGLTGHIDERPFRGRSGIVYITINTHYDSATGAYVANEGGATKWYAIAYKNTDGNFVEISMAGKGNDSKNDGCDTKEEAKSTYTIKNGWFDQWSECTRIRG